MVDGGDGGVRGSSAPVTRAGSTRWRRWRAPGPARPSGSSTRTARRSARGSSGRTAGPPAPGRRGRTGGGRVGRGPAGLGGGPPGRRPGPLRLDPGAPRPGGLAADRDGGHRPHARLPHRLLRGGRDRVRRRGTIAGDRVADRLPPVVPVDRVTGTTRPDAASPARSAAGCPRGDRRRRPAVRGARDRGHRRPAHGQLGDDGQRVDAGRRRRPTPGPTGSWPPARPPAVGSGRVGCRPPAPSSTGWGDCAAGRPTTWPGWRLTSPPGARGVTAVPWLGGARAPWWRPGARPASSVWPTATVPPTWPGRCSRRWPGTSGGASGGWPGPQAAGPAVVGLGLAGGGAASSVWVAVLTGTTGLPARWRRSGQAASAGAALLGSRALGEPWDLDAHGPGGGYGRARRRRWSGATRTWPTTPTGSPPRWSTSSRRRGSR